MELNITELRKQKRPLWMTEFDEECAADFLGGGGDYYSDRLHIDCNTGMGREIHEREELKRLLEGDYVEEDYLS